MFKKVEIFNREVIGIYRKSIKALKPDEQEWLIGALDEEICELRHAFVTESNVGQVDALMDVIYFAMGGLTRLGLTAEQSELIFGHIHKCNMAKKRGLKEARAVQAELDALKPEGWEAPEAFIKKVLET